MQLTGYQHEKLDQFEAEGHLRVEDCTGMPVVEINNRRFAISPAFDDNKKKKELLRCIDSDTIDRKPTKTR